MQGQQRVRECCMICFVRLAYPCKADRGSFSWDDASEKSAHERREIFDLNSIERDIIMNHMWPVTLFLCRGQKKDGLRHLLTSIAAVLRLHSGKRAIR